MSAARSYSSRQFITRHLLFGSVFGAIAGIVFMAFLMIFDEYTKTEAFCTTCHSMTLAAGPYRQSIHYNSPSGVRADCGDCHVAEGVFKATLDHLIGAKDLFSQIMHPEVDDPVISALHLPDMAFKARKWFRNRDSEPCRVCHKIEALTGTRANTAAIHLEDAEGKTCIDCHENLVHRKVPGEKTFKRDAWNRMIEQEFDLEEGEAARILAK